MAALQSSVCTLLLVATLCIGCSLASHETHQVPMPPGVTIWQQCIPPAEVIEHHYIGCYTQLDQFMQGAGSDIAAQCAGIEVLNECIKTNVSLHCPDLYRQYYRDMVPFLPTLIMFCGSTMGLISIEEWEHIVWIRFEQMYFNYLAEMSSTEQPEATTEQPAVTTETAVSTKQPAVTTQTAVSTKQPAVTTESAVSPDVMTQGMTQNNDVDDVTVTANATNSGNNIEDVVNGTANSTNSDLDLDLEDDVSSGDDDVKMVTSRMSDDIRNVTERFMASTTTAPRVTTDKHVTLMEVLTTAAAARTEDEATN